MKYNEIRDILRQGSGQARYEIRGLYAIIDNTFTPEKSHIDLACEFLVGGCKLLQLRMKNRYGGKKHYSSSGAERSREVNLWNDEAFEVAEKIMELKKLYDFTFIVNDYVDVAAEVGADGVHVGTDDMPIDKIRKRVGSRLIIGYSAHSIDEAKAAEKEVADYVAFGAIYPTNTKGPCHPVQGIEKLRELVAQLSVPVVAIGGINRNNVDEVLSTGVSSVAMITGLTKAEDVAQETKWYVDRII